jgi:hypothetical protein
MESDPEELAAVASHELHAAESSEPAEGEDDPEYDPTATSDLESDLENLKGAAEELEDD